MSPFMATVTLSPDALVRIEGGEVVTWAECERRLLAARTPAPEGEVVCSGCEGHPVFPNVPCAVCGAYPVVPAPEGEAAAIVRAYKERHAGPDSWFGNHLESVAVEIEQAAFCQPVVPVGVRQRVLDELDKAWVHGQRRTSWRRDEAADAILAVLDTKGADHD